MPKTSDIKLGGRLKILLAGINGSGKTRFYASFPGPMYIFDFDNRLSTIKKDYPNADIEYDTYDLKNFKQFDTILEKWSKNGCPFMTVVVDSITSLTISSVLYALSETHGKTVAGLQLPSFDEYATETTVTTKLIEILSKICRGHVIVTAHPLDKLETKKEGDKVQITKTTSLVAYGSKVSSIVPNYFDEIYALRSGVDLRSQPFRCFFTAVNRENEILAKTSLPLPARMDWTNKDAFTVLKEELAKNSIDVWTSLPKFAGFGK